MGENKKSDMKSRETLEIENRALKSKLSKLEKTKKSLQYIIDGTKTGTWEWNIHTGETSFNEMWAEIIGYSLQELSPTSLETWKNLTHPDDLPKVFKIIQKHFKGETDFFEYEHRMKHKTGQWIWILGRGKILEWTEDGYPLVMYGTHQVITKRKVAEESLKKSRKDLEITLNSIGDAVISTNISGMIIRMNPVASKLTGWSFEEAQGKSLSTVLKLYNSETNQPVEPPVYNVLKSGKTIGLSNHTVLDSKDGNRYHISDSAAPIKDDKGDIVGVVLVFRDITESYRYRQKIKESEERFNKILETIPDLVSVHDTEMNIVYSNWNGFGSVPENRRNPHTKCYKAYRDYDTICPDCRAKKVIQTKQPFRTQVELPDHKWYDIRVLPILDESGECNLFIEWVHEITDIKKTEMALRESRKKAKASNKAKSQFLANMSHELRTPLNGIIGFSELLKTSGLNEKQKGYIEDVLYSSQHLLQLITDILDFSKIESGKLTLENKRVCLQKLLKKLSKIIKPSAEKKGLSFHMLIEDDIPRCIYTDPLRLNQVLINLLSNAVKFTEFGSVQLKIDILEENNRCIRLRFSVCDTGIGIPEDMREEIFEMFTQVDADTNRQYGGTGLGLSITKRILEQMGSTLELVSTPGKGCVFSFDINFDHPEIKRNETERKNFDEQLCEDEKTFDKTILIVVDDLFSAKLTRKIINRHMPKATIMTTDKSLKAIQLFKTKRPDIVLMDINLPGKCVQKAISEIRAATNNHTRPKIIGMTADVRENIIREAIQNGMDGYIKKPLNIEEFLVQLRR